METSRTITISLPQEMIVKAEALAESEGRSVSELLGDAFQDYLSVGVLRSMEDVRRYAQTRNPHRYTEEDIPRLIKEVRAEMAAEEEATLRTAKAS
jgi:metal-responsive CopG/Arc/MetJ family transcriptional regulator